MTTVLLRLSTRLHIADATMASSSAAPERRIALDGNEYTYEEFVAWYDTLPAAPPPANAHPVTGGATQPAAAPPAAPPQSPSTDPVACGATQLVAAPPAEQFWQESEFFNSLSTKLSMLSMPPNFPKAATVRDLINLAYTLSDYLPLDCRDLAKFDVRRALQADVSQHN